VDRLANMEVFVRVAQLGSFSTAAGQLGMSKSTVSKHIAALEERLGVRLLNRTTRRLSLTQYGEIYRDHCLRILQEVADANENMDRFAAEPRGRLKVNAPMSFGMLHLAPLLPGFMREHPKVEIDLALNDRRVDLIDEGFDVAVRIGRLDDSSLIARKLASSTFACAAGPGYLKRRRPPEHPDDLRNHNCLRYTLGRSPGEWRFERDGESRVVSVSGRISGNNGDILRQAAILGEGVVYQPRFLLDDALSGGDLVELLTDWRTPTIDIHAVYPEARHVSPKLRVFIDYLVAAFRGRTDWRADPSPRSVGAVPA